MHKLIRFLTIAACSFCAGSLTSQGATSISPGQIIGDSINPPNGTDIYSFTAIMNDRVNIALLSTNGPGETRFQVYDPDGLPVTDAGSTPVGSFYRSYRENLPLSKGGLYTIRVQEYDMNETYDYQLSFIVLHGADSLEEGDGPNTIQPGQFTGGRIENPVDMDLYRFEANANDRVNIALLSTNGPGQTRFQVYDRDCVLVTDAGSTDVGDFYVSSRENLLLSKGGLYTIHVRERDLNEPYGYQLSFIVLHGADSLEEGDGPDTIQPGQFTGGRIENPVDMDLYRFEANANDRVNIALLSTNGPGETRFQVYDSDGLRVTDASWTDVGDFYVSSRENLLLSKGGDYTIHVREDNLNESYGYTLTMIKIPGPNSSDPGDGPWILSPGEARSATIVPGDLDAFGFHAIAGDTIKVKLRKTGGSGLNPRMLVYAPDRSVSVATATTTSNRLLQIMCSASQTGDYVIFVRDDGVNEAFAYELGLIQYPIVPPSSGNTQFLAIFQCTNHVIVRWETASAGFILESSDRPCSLPGGPPNVWSPVSITPRIIADHFYVDLGPVTSGNQFYRLRCMSCPAANAGE